MQREVNNRVNDNMLLVRMCLKLFSVCFMVKSVFKFSVSCMLGLPVSQVPPLPLPLPLDRSLPLPLLQELVRWSSCMGRRGGGG